MELLVFPKENHTFRDPKGSQVEAYVEVYVGAKLELILGPMLEPCWEVFGECWNVVTSEQHISVTNQKY